uniref:Glycosyltransferase family 92 protein n=1 Tax=Panagrellus redivivus TaxID=6233 RepID=A0A7E4V0K2_PANRE
MDSFDKTWSIDNQTLAYPPTDDIRQYMYIRSAFRVSDEEIRLSVVKDVNNTNSLTYSYGRKQGRVALECHQPTCPDYWSPPCTINGYIGRIWSLHADDNDAFLTLKSKSGIVARVKIEDVRKPTESQNQTYPHTLGVCLQPMYYVTDYPMLIQFFEFWLNEGATKFYFYWESMSPQVRALIKWYQSASKAEIELIPWSRLPVSPNADMENNPNAYWFRLEVFLGIFDCLVRARYNVKYVAQTDLDETIFVNGSQSLIQYLEFMNEKHRDAVDVHFLSRMAYIESSNKQVSHPFEFSFDAYKKFSVNKKAFGKPYYTKIVHRPERNFKVHIHKSQIPEAIPGSHKHYTHVDASPQEASVFHFRRFTDKIGRQRKVNTTLFANTSKAWETNFKKRQLTKHLSKTIDWTYTLPKFTHDLEVCRNKQADTRFEKCHNLLACEEKIGIDTLASLIRANNSWYFV